MKAEFFDYVETTANFCFPRESLAVSFSELEEFKSTNPDYLNNPWKKQLIDVIQQLPANEKNNCYLMVWFSIASKEQQDVNVFNAPSYTSEWPSDKWCSSTMAQLGSILSDIEKNNDHLIEKYLFLKRLTQMEAKTSYLVHTMVENNTATINHCSWDDSMASTESYVLFDMKSGSYIGENPTKNYVKHCSLRMAKQFVSSQHAKDFAMINKNNFSSCHLSVVGVSSQLTFFEPISETDPECDDNKARISQKVLEHNMDKMVFEQDRTLMSKKRKV